jgi:hypothetical protein
MKAAKEADRPVASAARSRAAAASRPATSNGERPASAARLTDEQRRQAIASGTQNSIPQIAMRMGPAALVAIYHEMAIDAGFADAMAGAQQQFWDAAMEEAHATVERVMREDLSRVLIENPRLERLLQSKPTPGYDLEKLTDEELAVMKRLTLKARSAGEESLS